jgi:hypothetical protein
MYVRCSRERETANALGADLILLEDVTVRVGGARRYDSSHDRRVNDIDVVQPVFPISGSFKRYQCHVVSDYMQNAGKNCYVFNDSNAAGLCYTSESGGWRCVMDDYDETNKMLSRESAAPR